MAILIEDFEVARKKVEGKVGRIELRETDEKIIDFSGERFKEARFWIVHKDYIISDLVRCLSPGKSIAIHRTYDSVDGERMLKARERELQEELRKLGTESEYEFTIEPLFIGGYKLLAHRKGAPKQEKEESRILDFESYVGRRA